MYFFNSEVRVVYIINIFKNRYSFTIHFLQWSVLRYNPRNMKHHSLFLAISPTDLRSSIPAITARLILIVTASLTCVDIQFTMWRVVISVFNANTYDYYASKCSWVLYGEQMWSQLHWLHSIWRQGVTQADNMYLRKHGRPFHGLAACFLVGSMRFLILPGPLWTTSCWKSALQFQCWGSDFTQQTLYLLLIQDPMDVTETLYIASNIY